MTFNLQSDRLQFETVEFLIDAMVQSTSLNDFCRAIVHSDLSQGMAQGCHVFSLNSEAKLILVSGYGLAFLDIPDPLSVWDENPISACVREKVSEFQHANPEREQSVLAIPLLKETIPIGAITLTMGPQVKTVPIHETLMPILSKLGTYCLTTLLATAGAGETNGFSEAKESNGEDLTSRQIRVLELMADGKVNLEIARELMVSESTVRQETVRIYRALGVPNRFDAAKKARALGLINRQISQSAST